jgi:hypothetical protein
MAHSMAGIKKGNGFTGGCSFSTGVSIVTHGSLGFYSHPKMLMFR